MKRSFTVSQNVRVFVIAAAIAVGAVGCGSSSNPDNTGTAGSGGTGAGGTSGGGTSGGGTTGTACTLADVNRIFLTTQTPQNTGCTVAQACHDSNGSAAGLDLQSAGWQTKLVGKSPVQGRRNRRRRAHVPVRRE